MKKFKKILLITVPAFFVFAVLGLTGLSPARAAGPPAVNLGTAGNFAILSKAGITNTGSSLITGNIGASPISSAAMNTVWCSMIAGTIYGVDGPAQYVGSGDTTCFAGNPPLANKTLVDNAVANMETAYTDAAGRTPGVGANLNVGGGTLSGQNFVPGTYTWGTPVTITGDITLTGSATDVWLFQIAGTLNISSAKKVILSGGAQVKNVFWQVTGATTLGTYSTFNGNILDQTNIALQTGAVLNGRALAQTAVTLDANAVTIASAATTQWNLVGNYTLTFTCVTGCSGDYLHTMNIATQNSTGDFSGTGFYNPDNTITWDINGNTIGNGLTYVINYTGVGSPYTINGSGTIDQNGNMSGTAAGPGQTFTWKTTNDIAEAIVGAGVKPAECTGNYTKVIHGTNGANTLNGTSGNDIIFGYGGNDKING
ncbi:MAG: ice-binding family protein, partial [Candidatus Saccharibacteria bacterium]|nr:ice-binding family protein [Candidatus Saccharibacteria bacterium]